MGGEAGDDGVVTELHGELTGGLPGLVPQPGIGGVAVGRESSKKKGQVYANCRHGQVVCTQSAYPSSASMQLSLASPFSTAS